LPIANWEEEAARGGMLFPLFNGQWAIDNRQWFGKERSTPMAHEKKTPARGGPPTQWDPIADWYDQLVGEAGSEYHRHVIIPGVLRLLGIAATPPAAGKTVSAAGGGERILDVACGQGVLCRVLHNLGAEVTGVDASAELLRMARGRGDPAIRYVQADARDLTPLPEGQFSAAICVLAIQNIHPLPPLMAGIARCLRSGEGVPPLRPAGVPPAASSSVSSSSEEEGGKEEKKERENTEGKMPSGRAGETPAPRTAPRAPGRLVIVMMHPCFRGLKCTAWGWDEKAAVQYRRVDRYLVPRKEPIVTHPGSDPKHYTWSFHRPIEAYVKALRSAGLLVDAMEEWPSHKTSEPGGPRSAAENLARKEIPMFLALRAIKLLPGQISRDAGDTGDTEKS
jgi:SAM-dependent methyltransferase